ncbi:MAG: glycosyltransferase family 39 protein [Candidatus Margulisbacteria bacterium]|nr:glycosyltransferase family 39 protein [Candidatus Margulisiibacteriota bacterium]
MVSKKLPQISLFSFFAFFFIGLRILLTFLTPLTADEGYYLQWAYHPALSYMDHPGMVSWINSLFIFLFKEPLVSIRIAAAVCLTTTLFFVYKTIMYLTNDKTKAYLGALLYFLIPYNFIFAITMQVDQPLLMFFSMAVFFSLKYINENKPKYLYILTVLFGLAFLSKYMIIVPIVSLFIYLLITNKKLIINKHFLFSILIFLIIISPILIWNFNNNWSSLSFHASRIGTEPLFKSLIEYILEQFLYITPMIWINLIIVNKTKKNKLQKIAYTLFISVMIFFLVFSLKTKIWPHWTSLAYFPLSIYLASILEERRLKTLTIHIMIFISLLVTCLGFTGPRVFLDQGKFNQNRNLITKLEQETNTSLKDINVYADFHGACGELSYYLKKQVYMPTKLLDINGRWGANQHALWLEEEISTTAPIIVFASSHFETELKKHYKSVEKLDVRLFTIEGHINRNNFYLCR